MRSPRSTPSLGRSVIRWNRVAAAALAALSLVGGAAARDRGADGKFEKRTSSHFVLYQDVDIDETGGLRGSRRFEQQVLAELERGYDALDGYLGLRPPRKIDVVVYDPGLFDAQFAGLFRFPAAGFYHGVIRIRGGTSMTVNLSRVLHHELVHAAFDVAAPSVALPGWFNEGYAEWFEMRTQGKRHLSYRELHALTMGRSRGALFALSDLTHRGFGRFGTGSARIAYLQSYAFIEFLGRSYGEGALREYVLQVVRTGNLERSSRRVFRASLADLEGRFLAELG